MTTTDKTIFSVLFSGFIMLQLYWAYADPRTTREKLSFYIGLHNKNKLYRYTMLLAILLIVLLSHILSPRLSVFRVIHSSFDPLCILLGILLYIFGLTTAMWARIIMKNKWSPAGEGHQKERQDELFTSGIFQITRNPIYVGIIAMYLGFFITLRNPLIILVSIPIVFFYHSAVVEERYLENQFGKKYLDYKKAVPRFLFK